MAIKNLILKPGTADVKIPGKFQPGTDLGRFILDWLVLKGILTTEDCCEYSVVGGGGGGAVSEVSASFNTTTNQLTVTVDGISSVPITISLDAGDVRTTGTLTINGVTFAANTTLQTILNALAPLAHPPAALTNNAAPFSWSNTTQAGNIPQSATISYSSGTKTVTFTPGDGTAATVFSILQVTANGLQGTGIAATPIELGGTLNQDTTIDGVNATYSLILERLKLFQAEGWDGTNTLSRLRLPSSGASPTSLSNQDLGSGDGGFIQLDVNGENKLTWLDGNTGDEIGFLAWADTFGTHPGDIGVKTKNVAAGTATNGQVLTLIDNATGQVEFQTVAGGGGGITGQEEGVATGGAGSVTTINFIGGDVTAAQAGAVLNVTVKSILGTYDDDAAAALGGVPVGGYYQLSLTNSYGLPDGLHKTRTA
jgi:hypothetical protein